VAYHSRGQFSKALTHYHLLQSENKRNLAWYLTVSYRSCILLKQSSKSLTQIVTQYQQMYMDEDVSVYEREIWEHLDKKFFRGFFGLSEGAILSEYEPVGM
jgi:hypothetical protein